MIIYSSTLLSALAQFTPPYSELAPLNAVINSAETTREDVESAKKDWEKRHEDEVYQEILNADGD